jgi:FkbM family methyltransferase
MPTSQARPIDWAQVCQRLEHAQGSTRLSRILKAPLRTASVAGMRRFGWGRPVSVPLPWGDTFYGHLPEAITSAVWRMSYYEPMTTRFVIEMLRPGDVFVDIGAHFGYFTLLASRLVGPQGKVVAVEAVPSTFAMLSENVRRNGLENVELHNCAAYSEETSLTFKVFDVVHSSLNTAFSARGTLEGRQAAFSEVSIEAKPVDRLLEPYRSRKISIIKVDAESSEEFVLQGLAETLSANRPTVVLELGGSAADDVARVDTITSQLYAAGYKAKRWQNGQLEVVPETAVLPYDNYIFIHSSLIADEQSTSGNHAAHDS